MFVRLKEASEAEKRPMNQIINEALEAYFSQKSVRDLRFDNVPFGRTQFAPTLWTKSVTVGAQSLRPPINWDIIPTQVPKLSRWDLTHLFLISIFIGSVCRKNHRPSHHLGYAIWCNNWGSFSTFKREV
jgi:hypothetical protein